MKPAPFRYVRAESLEHALAVKAEQGEDARFLAGGQSLVPAMNFRLAQPAMLIDLNGVRDLDYVRADGTLRIGALTRHRTIERDALIARHTPLLHEAAPHVAHPQIRNRGTFCGNLAHADPASEFPAIVLALGGRLRAQSKRGERWIAADGFFKSVFTTPAFRRHLAGVLTRRALQTAVARGSRIVNSGVVRVATTVNGTRHERDVAPMP